MRKYREIYLHSIRMSVQCIRTSMQCIQTKTTRLPIPKQVLLQIVKTHMKCRINAAFHLGLHFLLKSEESSRSKIHHNLEIPLCDPLKYIMCNPTIFAFICMGKSTRLQEVKLIIIEPNCLDQVQILPPSSVVIFPVLLGSLVPAVFVTMTPNWYTQYSFS